MKAGEPKLTNHFFLPEDQHLFDYDQIFSVSSMWIELGMENTIATYDLYVRDMPKNRNFLLFGGLEEIIESIQAWHFTKDEVDFLLKNNVVTKKAAAHLRNFKFSGDIWAMPEGTIFFPGEPVVRLTAPIWQINLFTFFLINALSSNTIFFSKFVRSILASGNKISVVTAPVTRAHSNESSLKFGRVAYILGAPSAMVPSFARKFNLPMTLVNTKAYHAFIQSFPSELEAMRSAVSVLTRIGLMVDTYNFKQGVKNAITVALEVKKEKGETIAAIVIDSGKNVADFSRQAKYARCELDKADLQSVKITVTGNFDEQKIAELIKLKTPANAVIACTELVTSSDDPKLEAVLKVAEFIHNGVKNYGVKLTQGKISYPGVKQVFRKLKNKKLAGDTIGLQGEKLGTPLLKKIVSQGKLIYKLPTLDDIKLYTANQLKTLPTNLKNVNRQYKYNVALSNKLIKLFEQAKKQHLSKG